jgi:predicted permease
MGLRLVEGRFFDQSDMRSEKGVVVVSRSVVDGYWPGQSVLGKRIRVGGRQGPDEEGEPPWLEIIGVADDVKHYGLDQEETMDFAYLPMLSNDDNDLRRTANFVLRTSVPPTQLTSAVRSELASLDRNVPLSRVITLERLIADSRAQVSFTVLVLMIASLLALTLAAIGLYGVISYIVSQRTREIGVRLALGAQRQDVVRQVVKGGAIVSVAGIGLGLVLALATTRLLESQLFGVSRYDPPTFTTVPILLFAVAMLASVIPALRASKVEPYEALRQD